MFHGDLHPGNIVLLRNNRFALIDLGTVGNLDANFVNIYKQEALAIAHHDYVKAADLYCLMCDSIQVVDLAAFRLGWSRCAGPGRLGRTCRGVVVP